MRGLLFACLLLITGAVLSGCSGGSGGLFSNSILDFVKDHYKIDDTVKSSVDPDDTAQVFIAKDKSISDVKSELIKEKSANKLSDEKDGKQVLVYDDYFVTLTKDEKDPSNTLVEVATYGFVRDNYHPSFFDGLLTYYLLSNLFGVNNWGSRQNSRCVTSHGCYNGYNSSGGHYKGPGSKPLFRSSTVRGGGPNAGK